MPIRNAGLFKTEIETAVNAAKVSAMKNGKEIDMCKTLDQLFELWKRAHEAEGDESFLPDGFLCEKVNAKVLFVCREAHDEGGNGSFWMKDVAVKHKKTKYYNLMTKCLAELKDKSGKDCPVEECAYMNINKRGGGSTCSMKMLKAYAKKYKDFLVKEVKIIDPEFIIFLGKLDCDIYKIVKEGFSKNNGLYLYPRHPSVYWNKLSIDELKLD